MNPFPEKFEESMRRLLGADFPRFESSLHETPPTSIRVNRFKNKSKNVNPPVPWTDTGQYLPSRPVFTLDPLLHAGTYYVQEASSMFLEQAIKQSVDLNQRLKILDLCAAPGGKSTHLLSFINRESLLVTNETIRSRASVLSENIQKWGYPNTVVTNNDPADFKNLRGFFDVIVVDAPCSGEGLFRKDPDAMKEWSPENVQLCSSRQKRIIADVWGALRGNGIFIYCTCTYNTLENEENLQWLRTNHAVEFIKISIDPTWGVEEVNSGNLTAYRFYPHRTRGEGFFLSVMRKLETTEPVRIKSKKGIASPLNKLRDWLQHWIRNTGDSTLFQFNDLIFYMPSINARETEFLPEHLRILYMGTNLASVKHDKLIPEHALALSTEVNEQNFPSMDVDLDIAIRYLRKESIDTGDYLTGFTLLTYQQIPIGWVNVLSNRVNNMYPSDWRIRMA